MFRLMPFCFWKKAAPDAWADVSASIIYDLHGCERSSTAGFINLNFNLPKAPKVSGVWSNQFNSLFCSTFAECPGDFGKFFEESAVHIVCASKWSRLNDVCSEDSSFDWIYVLRSSDMSIKHEHLAKSFKVFLEKWPLGSFRVISP